jgi:hypothetical protein
MNLLFTRLLSSLQKMKTQETRLLIETVLRTADIPGGHTSLQRNNTWHGLKGNSSLQWILPHCWYEMDSSTGFPVLRRTTTTASRVSIVQAIISWWFMISWKFGTLAIQRRTSLGLHSQLAPQVTELCHIISRGMFRLEPKSVNSELWNNMCCEYEHRPFHMVVS